MPSIALNLVLAETRIFSGDSLNATVSNLGEINWVTVEGEIKF